MYEYIKRRSDVYLPPMPTDKFRFTKQEPSGALAASLRRRKFQLAERYRLPDDLLAGSLSQTHTRCGNSGCHCAQGEGHPVWQLTFMADGKKRVEKIPQEWVEDVRRRVEAGREFKEAFAEVCAANAQLLALWRQQTKGRRR
jgi:hypothetical protein